MNTVVTQLRERTFGVPRTARALTVWTVGPLTMLAGILWAVIQPWRLTLLHPRGQSFWWLFAEAPLFVVVVGVLFAWLVAPGVIEDLERAREVER
jgi:hypothetical protein